MARLAGELGYPSTREQVAARLDEILDRTDHAVFVAESDEVGDGGKRVTGWIHAFVQRTIESDPTVEICGLVVAEGSRGCGIGRLLMEQAERWGRGTRCSTMTVRSNIVRERAHKFYQRLGYSLVKTQRVFRKQVTANHSV